MAFLTKYGLYFGLVPTQLGRIHFVSPSASYTVEGRAYSASDDNDGLSPERALRTITQAYTNAQASAGEVIYLLDGTHTLTATFRVQKAGLTIMGGRSPQFAEGDTTVWANRPKATISFASAAAPGISVEANNLEIAYVTIVPAAGFSTVIFRNQNVTAPDGLYMHDFYIDMSNQPANLATLGIDFGYRADVAGLAGTSMTRLSQATAVATAYLSNFCINAGGAQGPGLLTATAEVTVSNARFHNRFGLWATAFVVATGTGYVYVNRAHFTAAGIGIGTDITGAQAGSVAGKAMFSDCRFSPSKPGDGTPPSGGRAISDFAAGVASSIECYVGGVATAYVVF